MRLPIRIFVSRTLGIDSAVLSVETKPIPQVVKTLRSMIAPILMALCAGHWISRKNMATAMYRKTRLSVCMCVNRFIANVSASYITWDYSLRR